MEGVTRVVYWVSTTAVLRKRHDENQRKPLEACDMDRDKMEKEHFVQLKVTVADTIM